jgi:hypothetical protein
LDYHICEEEDFDDFYPVASASSFFLDGLKKKRALFCLDEQELTIRGIDELDSIAINFNFNACPECNKTMEETREYLGYPELIIYSNSERFDNTIYSD